MSPYHETQENKTSKPVLGSRPLKQRQLCLKGLLEREEKSKRLFLEIDAPKIIVFIYLKRLHPNLNANCVLQILDRAIYTNNARPCRRINSRIPVCMIPMKLNQLWQIQSSVTPDSGSLSSSAQYWLPQAAPEQPQSPPKGNEKSDFFFFWGKWIIMNGLAAASSFKNSTHWSGWLSNGFDGLFSHCFLWVKMCWFGSLQGIHACLWITPSH